MSFSLFCSFDGQSDMSDRELIGFDGNDSVFPSTQMEVTVVPETQMEVTVIPETQMPMESNAQHKVIVENMQIFLVLLVLRQSYVVFHFNQPEILHVFLLEYYRPLGF